MGSGDQYFRANVGAVIGDGEGRVLAFERADVPGAWQLPQGGLAAEEEPERGALREIREETGISAESLELLGPHPVLLAYELPPDLRTKKTGRGQVQYWFYYRLAERVEPRLEPGGEFRAWRWTALSDLAAQVPAFRRPVYESLVQHVPVATR